MAKISPDALTQVQAALENYIIEVNASELAQSTKDTYIPQAKQFVRWLDDDFVPGGQLG